MKQNMVRSCRASARIFFIALCMAGKSVLATMHIVQFGGNVGYTYSPASFSSNVGDTVKWEGDFGMHPFSSTSVPANAKTWHMASGASFSYVITEPGTYNYRCDAHYTLGMIGVFTALATEARNNAPNLNTARTVGIALAGVTASGRPIITFTVPAGPVTIKIFSMHGRKDAVILNHYLPAGMYTLPLGAELKARGPYLVELTGIGGKSSLVFQFL